MAEKQAAGGAPVNVNAASVKALRDNVKGIGQSLAERIVAYRDEHGPFHTVQDLAKVTGIEPGMVEQMAHQLTVGNGDSGGMSPALAGRVRPEDWEKAQDRAEGADVPASDLDELLRHPQDATGVAPVDEQVGAVHAPPKDDVVTPEEVALDPEGAETVEGAEMSVGESIKTDQPEMAEETLAEASEPEEEGEETEPPVRPGEERPEEAVEPAPAPPETSEEEGEPPVRPGHPEPTVESEPEEGDEGEAEARRDDVLTPEEEALDAEGAEPVEGAEMSVGEDMDTDWPTLAPPAAEQEGEEEEQQGAAAVPETEEVAMMYADDALPEAEDVEAHRERIEVPEESAQPAGVEATLESEPVVEGIDEEPEPWEEEGREQGVGEASHPAAPSEPVRAAAPVGMASGGTTPGGTAPAATRETATGRPATTGERRERSFWNGLALVVLGAIGGALLTLLLLVLTTGTLDFVSRNEFEALSRNVDTIQRNAELSVDIAGEQAERLGGIEQEVGRIDPLSERLTETESGLGTLTGDVGTLEQEVGDLESTLTERADVIEERVGETETQVTELGDTLDEVQEDVAGVRGRVQAFDTFFTQLRELLGTLDQVTEEGVAE